MARREPDGDTGVEVAIDRVRSLDRRLSDLEAWVAGKLPHGHAADGVAARAARVYLGSAQSIASSTWEKVAVDTVTDDPDGLFDSVNNQIGADKAGWWLVAVGVGFDGSTGGNRRFAALARNGTRMSRSTGAPLADNNLVSVADIVKVASGDTFESQAWQDSGGSLGLQAVSVSTWLSAAYLGSA